MPEGQSREIGYRLRQIREHLGETQTVFAERFGLSRDDIANYERCVVRLALNEGLVFNPGKVDWKADLSKYPPELREDFEALRHAA